MSCSAIGKPKKPRVLASACSNPLSGTCKIELISNGKRCGKRSPPPGTADAVFDSRLPAFIRSGQLVWVADRLLYVGRMTAAARKIHIPALFSPCRATRFCS